MTIEKEIRDVLEGMEYQQHNQNIIVSILESYPSLQEKLKEAKENGVKKIEVLKEHALVKPDIKNNGEVVIIYINN